MGKLSRVVADLFPGYFALIMATGIVSVAAKGTGLVSIASGLLWINVAAYAVLSALLLARLVRHPGRVMADLGDHARGPGFFTVVAGTCVLGAQLALVGNLPGFARPMWLLGGILWILVTYAFFASTVLRDKKPRLEDGLNGAWLIAIVATQSVSVLGTIAAAGMTAAGREAVLFLGLCLFLLGSMLYLTIITLIFYRFTFLEMTPRAMTPPYWINMGAAAITVLSGSSLLLAQGSPVLTELRPFVLGFTLLFWSTATWWIPLLLVLGVWRHVVRRIALVYDPQYWGMVFPLGMYTVCTLRLSEASGVSQIAVIPRYVVFAALVAWLVTFFGMIKSVVAQGRASAPTH